MDGAIAKAEDSLGLTYVRMRDCQEGDTYANLDTVKESIIKLKRRKILPQGRVLRALQNIELIPDLQVEFAPLHHVRVVSDERLLTLSTSGHRT